MQGQAGGNGKRIGRAPTDRSRRDIGAALGAAIVVVAGWFAVPGAQAAEVAGVELADAIELDGVALRLNGAGERTLYVVRTYVAALYVARPSMQPQTLLAQSGPRRLSLTMLAALSTEWVAERILARVRENTAESDFARLEPHLARFVAPFLALPRMRKGDRVDVDAVGGATRLSVGGRVIGREPGVEVFDALLRAFIGAHPIDPALGRALLGLPATPGPGT